MKLVVAIFTLLAMAPLGLFVCALLGHWWFFPVMLAAVFAFKAARGYWRRTQVFVPWPPSGRYELPASRIEGVGRLPDGRPYSYGPWGNEVHDLDE